VTSKKHAFTNLLKVPLICQLQCTVVMFLTFLKHHM